MIWLLFPKKSCCDTLHRTPGISYNKVKKRMPYPRQVIVNTFDVCIFLTSTVYFINNKEIYEIQINFLIFNFLTSKMRPWIVKFAYPYMKKLTDSTFYLNVKPIRAQTKVYPISKKHMKFKCYCNCTLMNTSFDWSNKMKTRSNLDKRGELIFIFSATVFDLL